MENIFFYSIRMHAAIGERHVSGAERIVSREKIEGTVGELVDRAIRKGCTRDQVVVNVEPLVTSTIRRLTALDVITIAAPDMHTARSAASRLLQLAGVSSTAIEAAIDHVSNGAAPSGGNMRGAMIMDAKNGARLEPDRYRGVRASRFDWSDNAGDEIFQRLSALGLTHSRTREALALATKAAHAPGMVAELCWSDDPDYTAGYMASLRTGYVRFPCLKQVGDAKGGRAFFVNREVLDMDILLEYLQQEAVMITDVGLCRAAIEPEAYFSRRKSTAKKLRT
ncbi:MAG TPA: 6-carboxyhexanoate--CoA ligase [Nitrospirota bacterium]|nr:6-carboxyhexanoate--CoA ligase [Nitrospirota bacterium]